MRLAYRFGLVVLLATCGPATDGGSTPDDSGTNPRDGAVVPDAFAGPWEDFPAAPLIDPDAAPPASTPEWFADPAAGTTDNGPCVIEPESGTLFPRNWLRPRFVWTAPAGQNLFELRLSAASQLHPLVVYTTANQWTMSASLWEAVRQHSIDDPITVTVRAAVSSGTELISPITRSAPGEIAIAPAEAPGAIVYWTTTGGSALRGFHVGDETVTDIVRPSTAGGDVQCIGCHSSTPDGEFAAFAASPTGGSGDPARLRLRAADGSGGEPTFLTPTARTLMDRQYQQQPTFSPLHWSAGDRVAVTMYPINGRWEITWTDLETNDATQGIGWGILNRGGDANQAAYASFFRTSDRLVYVSSPWVASGVRADRGDLAIIPFGDRAGGTAALIAGASVPDANEYYPTVSPDDRWIAYNRTPLVGESYNNASAEVFVISADGGTPVRLAANDPIACAQRTSPGLTNSWPKWAPAVSEFGGRRYYWLTFSSTRGAGRNPQLYITPVIEENGTLHTYPALYLWNQPAAENNHTPAWEYFDIPIGRAATATR